jgi:hypothetical protein
MLFSVAKSLENPRDDDGEGLALTPTFIVGWHPERQRVQLAVGMIVGASAQATLSASPERRYALREIKPSIVQRCRPERLRRSLCDLPSARAEAPRCRSHRHGRGRAVGAADRLKNGLPLTKIHHARFRHPPDRDRPGFPHSCL